MSDEKPSVRPGPLQREVRPDSHGENPGESLCEVCGQPATTEVCDGIETDPVRGEKPMMWFRNFLPEYHYFCGIHTREPIKKCQTDEQDAEFLKANRS